MLCAPRESSGRLCFIRLCLQMTQTEMTAPADTSSLPLSYATPPSIDVHESRKGLAALILGANAPDIDVFLQWVPWAPLATRSFVLPLRT